MANGSPSGQSHGAVCGGTMVCGSVAGGWGHGLWSRGWLRLWSVVVGSWLGLGLDGAM